MVNTLTIIAIIISLAISVGAPIVLVVIFKRKLGISIKVVLFGMLTFFFFSQVLEQLAHAYFLFGNETTEKLFKNPWMYMLYGGLMAGIFEETGRFIIMKYVLKHFRRWRDGLAFGIGHGGMEAIILVGLNSVVMIIFAMMINSGNIESLLVNAQVREVLAPISDQLTNSSSYFFLLGGIERLSAIAIHIGLSILVLYAIRNQKMIYLFYAIIIHAIFDFPVALYQADVIENIFVIEAWIAIIGVGSVIWTVKSRKIFVE
ncbi:YhfC family intramembrane metalloprotease [Lederbergia lenta]|uniref:Membrane protein n=1 Tax=Lederbergia lenta TaxID=1467 RepID=A0A2X4WJ42_LEDLE|nr:YhfC family intramembrane metalloprotease [Lederbergia lenta]MCM3112108.1 YhfC family intramembrane metalloprotease [Lederbergia lenta]MEC2323278.1 YhfC family intramembrane metalloprotease [Lederbergia lenta]SQI63131.1 membrane protein [Lederbergia lenta]